MTSSRKHSAVLSFSCQDQLFVYQKCILIWRVPLPPLTNVIILPTKLCRKCRWNSIESIDGFLHRPYLSSFLQLRSLPLQSDCSPKRRSRSTKLKRETVWLLQKLQLPPICADGCCTNWGRKERCDDGGILLCKEIRLRGYSLYQSYTSLIPVLDQFYSKKNKYIGKIARKKWGENGR